MSGPSRLREIREEILREWRGCDEVTSLDSRVRPAAALLDAVMRGLRAAGMADGLDEEDVKRIWKELAGDFIARHSVPASVKDGVLVLHITQPSMRFHLDQMKPLLLERIQQKLGRDRIKSIRFQHG